LPVYRGTVYDEAIASLRMDRNFIEIADVTSLDRFIVDLEGSPGVLFKHSNTCGISSRAFGEMTKLQHPIGLIIVQKARPVSDEIERRWQVSHETPQVLILRDGKVVWDASHFQVKAEEIEAALEIAGSQQAST
jgi:monothiol bacilliredoxin